MRRQSEAATALWLTYLGRRGSDRSGQSKAGVALRLPLHCSKKCRSWQMF